MLVRNRRRCFLCLARAAKPVGEPLQAATAFADRFMQVFEHIDGFFQ